MWGASGQVEDSEYPVHQYKTGSTFRQELDSSDWIFSLPILDAEPLSPIWTPSLLLMTTLIPSQVGYPHLSEPWDQPPKQQCPSYSQQASLGHPQEVKGFPICQTAKTL
ncbi:hypothetical protein UPYG_G00026300 [Umbra pygmaea]|uniref:Uncharacterized protein n=1 Tax=Umbra pygmaea TaxID=75934 RepID=A0ABD0XLX8_UMBPY